MCGNYLMVCSKTNILRHNLTSQTTERFELKPIENAAWHLPAPRTMENSFPVFYDQRTLIRDMKMADGTFSIF